jgi:hypothetical protein
VEDEFELIPLFQRQMGLEAKATDADVLGLTTLDPLEPEVPFGCVDDQEREGNPDVRSASFAALDVEASHVCESSPPSWD